MCKDSVKIQTMMQETLLGMLVIGIRLIELVHVAHLMILTLTHLKCVAIVEEEISLQNLKLFGQKGSFPFR